MSGIVSKPEISSNLSNNADSILILDGLQHGLGYEDSSQEIADMLQELCKHKKCGIVSYERTTSKVNSDKLNEQSNHGEASSDKEWNINHNGER